MLDRHLDWSAKKRRNLLEIIDNLSLLRGQHPSCWITLEVIQGEDIDLPYY